MCPLGKCADLYNDFTDCIYHTAIAAMIAFYVDQYYPLPAPCSYSKVYILYSVNRVLHSIDNEAKCASNTMVSRTTLLEKSGMLRQNNN